MNAVLTEDGARFEGKMFADCSYAGDLMAQAGLEEIEVMRDLAGIERAAFGRRPVSAL